jgi:hypothetical protein
MNQLIKPVSLQHLKRKWVETTEGKRLGLDLTVTSDLEPILNATAFSIVLRLDSIRDLAKTNSNAELAGRIANECEQIAKEARLCSEIGSYLLDKRE